MKHEQENDYIITSEHMTKLDQLITELQHLFLEIFSNYEVKKDEQP